MDDDTGTGVCEDSCRGTFLRVWVLTIMYQTRGSNPKRIEFRSFSPQSTRASSSFENNHLIQKRVETGLGDAPCQDLRVQQASQRPRDHTALQVGVEALRAGGQSHSRVSGLDPCDEGDEPWKGVQGLRVESSAVSRTRS